MTQPPDIDTAEDKSAAGNTFTHLDEHGAARVVDITDKPVMQRRAVAQALVTMQADTLAMILDGNVPKGDVLAVARVAGIQAAKRTSELIPLCHPLSLSSVKIAFEAISATQLAITASCKIASRTGVEMEALTAASVSALTLYDMCKSMEKGIIIGPIRLLEKSGGKSGEWTADTEAPPVGGEN